MSDHQIPSDESSGESANRPRPSVVGLGASAGGLQALTRFFAAVPADTGLAYVVVMHLSPEKESHLADLLQPHAHIPVMQVTETTPLEPDHVYVIPPGYNISAVDSHLRLTPLEEHHRDRAPVDHFFRTMSETFDGHSIAVVLTGTGSDGAQGVRTIRERGGIVVVQDPQEAEFDGMPRSAVETGAVDLVLGLEEMLPRILEFVRTHPRVGAADEARATNAERDRMARILTQVRIRTGHDFSRYKQSTIERRIERRMQLQGIEQLPAYLDMLRESFQEAAALADDLLINVTSFFRDPAVFEYLEREVVPVLFEGKGASNRLRVWSVGCATGEEAYSLGMLLLEEAARRDSSLQIQIFASDLHERSLHYAREGLYPDTIAADVSAERLERFFQEENGGYRVRKELRELVVFAPHNLLRDPPFSHLDLVCCRNVLIYLQRDVQEEVIDLFHYTLHGEGFLLLGTAETLERSELFRLTSKQHHVYRRRKVARTALRLPNLPLASPAPAAYEGQTAAFARRDAPAVYGTLHQKMVEQHAPPSLIVGPDHAVLHLSDRVGRYLQVAGGLPTSNVFQLVREELRLELRAALHLACERRETSRSKPIRVKIEGEMRNVVLRVSPTGEQETEGLALIIFDEVGESLADVEDSGIGQDARVAELDGELQLTRSRFQALVEEFETGQEEMRASNEELQSANEELRSTMEELETSREELQSTNEELQTLNQENRHKVDELSQLSSDLQNLLKVTDAATLFLDRSLRILRFTPRVAAIFNIRNADRGRPLADLTHRLGYTGLLDDARAVLETLIPSEREVQSEDGKWYLVRMVPYRTLEDRIDGAVITLVDVTTLKNTELALRESELRHRLIVENALNYAILTTDLDGRITSWSPGAEAVLGWTADEAVGQELAITFTREDRERGVPDKERELARLEGSAPDVRWHQCKDGSRVFIEGVLRRLRDADGELEGYLKIGQDTTVRRRIEQDLRASEERLRLFGEASSDVIWMRDAESLQWEYLSPAFETIYGYDRQSVLDGDNLRNWAELIVPEDREGALEALERVRAGDRRTFEYRVRRADGEIRWLRDTDFPIRDETGEIRRIGGIGEDVTERKKADAALNELNQTLELRVQERTIELKREIQERVRAEEARREVLQQLVTAEELERRRLSRELHDQMGQQVTGLLLGLRSLSELDDPARLGKLEELEALARQIAMDMQAMALELRPPALDTLGLVAALENHFEDWATRHGIDHDFHVRGLSDQRLSQELETTLYRTIQEGLTNTLKHAQATRVSLLLERRGGEVRAILEDDGVGFDVERTLALPEKVRRLGVRGMKERVALLGGEMEFESSPGRGTTLFIRVPDRPAEPANEDAPLA